MDLPRDEAGRRRQKSKGGFGTKREAERALRAALRSMETGSYVEPSTQRLGDYLIEWLAGQSSHLKPSTLASYRSKVRAYVLPRLGDVKLQQLTAAALNRFYAELLASGGRGGAPLSVRSVEYVHAILRKALGDAFKVDAVPVNVALKATPPRWGSAAARHPRSGHVPAWTAAQVRAFVEEVAEDRLRAAYVVAINNGLRRGELLGLRWCDVDLDEGRLAVRQTLGVIDHRLVFSTPKTQMSARRFRVDPVTLEALSEHRTRQYDERMAWGPAWHNTGDLVFTRENGSPVHPNWLIRQFVGIGRRAGLPPSASTISGTPTPLSPCRPGCP